MSELSFDLVKAATVQLVAHESLHLWLVGCGGTGSWLAPAIVRIARWYQQQSKLVTVTLVDPDSVETANVLRQNFCGAEVGLNKAATLALRYGLAWQMPIRAVEQPFDPTWLRAGYGEVHLLLGCVDNAAARQQLAQGLAANERIPGPRVWWLDAGNGDRPPQ